MPFHETILEWLFDDEKFRQAGNNPDNSLDPVWCKRSFQESCQRSLIRSGIRKQSSSWEVSTFLIMQLCCVHGGDPPECTRVHQPLMLMNQYIDECTHVQFNNSFQDCTSPGMFMSLKSECVRIGKIWHRKCWVSSGTHCCNTFMWPERKFSKYPGRMNRELVEIICVFVTASTLFLGPWEAWQDEQSCVCGELFFFSYIFKTQYCRCLNFHAAGNTLARIMHSSQSQAP